MFTLDACEKKAGLNEGPMDLDSIRAILGAEFPEIMGNERLRGLAQLRVNRQVAAGADPCDISIYRFACNSILELINRRKDLGYSVENDVGK